MTAFAKGVDYSIDHPDPAGLAAIGIGFACRYFGPGTPGKLATEAEVNTLASHGISVVTNAEGLEGGLLGGRAAGREWAARALVHASSLGMPADRPIYVSVDFDMTAEQWPQIADALLGVRDVVGPDRVGVYGGLRAVTHAHNEGMAAWYWQTYAWSHGEWAPFAHIRQTRNGVSLVGGTVDLDEATQPDYGQWKPGWTPGGKGTTVGLTEDQAKQLANAEFTLTHLYGEDGQPNQPLHVWAQSVTSRLAALQNLLTNLWTLVIGDEGTPSMLRDLRTVAEALDELERAPLIDAVAVANAIASRPEVTDAIAGKVAERLSGIAGSITLTGSMSGGIIPPSQ